MMNQVFNFLRGFCFRCLIFCSAFSFCQFRAVADALPFNLNEVKWLHYEGVKDWPVTSQLNVEVTPSHIKLDFDKTGQWKTTNLRPGEDDPVTVDANPWIFINQGGTWYAATFEWIRPNNTTKGRHAVNGDHIKQPPLADWSPKAGETYYFMVSGLARQGPEGSQERTNIVAVQWPDGGASASGGGGASASGGGNAGGSSGSGASVNAMTLTITCKSKKFLGIFTRRRVCGGELFSKLESYKLVEDLGGNCQEGANWGVHDGHAIWLKGCSGRFEVSGIPKGQSTQPSQPPQAGEKPASPSDQVSENPTSGDSPPVKGDGSGRFKLELVQTKLPCPGCGWLFDSTKLVIEHSAGTFTKTGPKMFVKLGGNRVGRVDWDLSSIPANATIKKATYYMLFNRHEGIANSDSTSVVKVFGWINNKRTLIKTLEAGRDIKSRGYNKVNNNVPFDYTDYVRRIR